MRADNRHALDGDADRVMPVDKRGHVVDGDQLLAYRAKLEGHGRLASAGIVASR